MTDKVEQQRLGTLNLNDFVTYIGIGANLGDKVFNCRRSLKKINHLPKTSVITCSALFKTEPVGVTGQDWYINCVAQVNTSQPPVQFLKNLLTIEARMGRVRKNRWEARNIDLDILLFGQEIVASDDLVIPHPLLHKRRFVLEPLSQLAPHLIHPLLGVTMQQLLDELPPGPLVEMVEESCVTVYQPDKL